MGAWHPQRQRLKAQGDALEHIRAIDRAARRLRAGFIGRDGRKAESAGRVN